MGVGALGGDSEGGSFRGLHRGMKRRPGQAGGSAWGHSWAGLAFLGECAGNGPKAETHLFTVWAGSQPFLCSSLVNPQVLYSFLLAIAFFFFSFENVVRRK